MGLKGDLHEVATVWKRSSWQVKAYLTLSAFLASGSIASLSDTVFRWKGFVRDALSFYQEYLSDQLLRILQLVFSSIHVPVGISHLLILSTLYLGANIRVMLFAGPSTRSRDAVSRATASYLGSMSAILIGMTFTGKEFSGESALGLFLGSAFCASVTYWFVGGATRLLWFVYLVGPFVIIGLVAAVNSGLTRLA